MPPLVLAKSGGSLNFGMVLINEINLHKFSIRPRDTSQVLLFRRAAARYFAAPRAWYTAALVLRYSIAILHHTMLHRTLYSIVRYSIVRYSIIWFSIVRYSVAICTFFRNNETPLHVVAVSQFTSRQSLNHEPYDMRTTTRSQIVLYM